jgi:agmatinase
MIRNIIVPYDGRSQYAGTSQSVESWREITRDNSRLLIQRHRGDISRLLVQAAVRDLCEVGGYPLVLGGDHSLTWPALLSLVDCHGPVTVLHFDAHHDSHPAVELTHWSVMYHIKNRLPVTVVPVGYHRHHPDRIPIAPSDPITGPVYLTVDVDYFDPADVPSVLFPVSCHPGQRTSLTSFRKAISLCAGPILGADIVEWRGADSASTEFNFVSQVYNLVLNSLGICSQ